MPHAMETLGQTLKAARLRRKLTASEAAKGTRIKIQHIEAIEQDDFSAIAAAAYAKGFIRIYAEFLEIDPTPLVEEYVEKHAPSRRAPLLPDENPPREPAPAARARSFFKPRVAEPAPAAPEPEPDLEEKEEIDTPPPRKLVTPVDNREPELWDQHREPPRINIPGEPSPGSRSLKWKPPTLPKIKLPVVPPRLLLVYAGALIIFLLILFSVKRCGNVPEEADTPPVVDLTAPPRTSVPGVVSPPERLPVVDALPEPYLE